MKCPLSKNICEEGSYPPDMEYKNCLEGECAWWYAENNTCALLTLAQGSVYVHKALLDMSKIVHCDVELRK